MQGHFSGPHSLRELQSLELPARGWPQEGPWAGRRGTRRGQALGERLGWCPEEMLNPVNFGHSGSARRGIGLLKPGEGAQCTKEVGARNL